MVGNKKLAMALKDAGTLERIPSFASGGPMESWGLASVTLNTSSHLIN